MFGGHGKILRVNLSESKITEEEIPEDLFDKYLTGAGLATHYLYHEVPKGADPLGPESELIFMNGTITGAQAPSTGRYNLVFKSPLTGIWAQSNVGGFWGVDFKKTGFDGIILQGISPKPVYLVIEEGGAELRDAKHLWGENVPQTTSKIKAELGDKFNVACIGIAGENQVRYAESS